MWFIKWAIKFNLRLAIIVCLVAGCIWLFQDKTIKKPELMTIKVGKTYITLDKDDAMILKAIDNEIQKQKDAEWANIEDEYKYKDADGNWHFRIPKEYYEKIEKRKKEEQKKRKLALPAFTTEDLEDLEDLIESGYALTDVW